MRLENLTNSLPKLNTKTVSKGLSEKFKDLKTIKIKLEEPKSISFYKPEKLTKKQRVKMYREHELKKKAWIFFSDFDDKKQKLINELSKVCDKNVIAQIEKADNPRKLTKILTKQENRPFKNCDKYLLTGKFVKENNSDKFLKNITLEMEKIQYKARTEVANFVLAREKALHVRSKNPKVIAIENILKEQYGCKFVSLKDNEKLARNVLKAFDIASKNGVKTPENVIISNFISERGKYLINDTILLENSPQNYFLGELSTTSALHVPLHEILHGTHPYLLSFSCKKIPQKFLKVKDELSRYSAKAPTHETFTELNTKRLINGLNPQEQALFDYLNIFA